MKVQTGRVTFYDDQRGFGFIRPDQGGADQFVHATALNGVSELRNGQRVSFDVEFDTKRSKEKAVSVSVIA